MEQKIARADFVIWTDGALETHAQQIDRLLANTRSRNLVVATFRLRERSFGDAT